MASKNKILLVVESPAKAKTISKYLGSDYIVRASYGHIVDLVSGKSNGIGVDLENNFTPKYAVLPDKKDKLKSIVDAAKEAELILLASDPDREGESIAWHLAEQLEQTKIPIKRVLFKSLDKKAIINSVANPTELDNNLFDAQQARRVLDRIVGFLVSPFLFNSIGPQNSAGRVQSVALRMVVDREREIENFKPEEYWNILATLAKNNDSPTFVAKYTGKVLNKETAEKIKTDLLGDKFVISEMEEKEKKRNPYPPLITSSLAATSAGRYKFAAARTMKAAQSLYEHGYITYMRTDSFRCSPESIENCRQWLKDNKHDVPEKANFYASKNGAQDAHEAIRPTDVNKLPSTLSVSEDEQKVYKLIWERFVASQMNPAIYDTASVTVKSSSNHILKANGRILKYKGWLALTGDLEQEDDDGADTKLPPLAKNDKLILRHPNVKAEQKFTQPPPRYSEKTLIKELEKKGIGRPSTYATIMTKITDRNYVIRKNDIFSASELGIKVADQLIKHFHFMKYEYTAEMEEKLDKIADGNLNYLEMMTGFYTPFKEQLRSAYDSLDKDYGFKCDICSSNMKLKHGRFGFFMACRSYPECKFAFSCDIVDEKPVRKIREPEKPKTIDGLQCPICSSPMRKIDGKYGPFYSCIEYPTCKGTAKVPFGKKCQECNGELTLTLLRDELKLGCMNYPNCKNIENVPDNVDVNWINPEKIKSKKIKPAIKKVIKSSSSKSN